MGCLERWGAPDPLAPPAQQAARASLQMAPKASSTPCSHLRTRTVSAGLRGGGRGTLPAEGQPSQRALPVRGALAWERAWTGGGPGRPILTPQPHFGPGMTCPCLGAQLGSRPCKDHSALGHGLSFSAGMAAPLSPSAVPAPRPKSPHCRSSDKCWLSTYCVLSLGNSREKNTPPSGPQASAQQKHCLPWGSQR